MKSIGTQAIIEGIRSRKDGSLGLTVSTPELSPTEKTVFFELQGVNLDLKITPLDVPDVEEIHVDEDLQQKSQSVRIRQTLYVLWQKNSEGMDFNDYYRNKTDKYILWLQSKIDEKY